MKKLSYTLLSALMMVMVLAGCSKSSNDDASSILRTVPSSASSVVLINLDHAVKSLGCTTDGSTIKLSKDLQKTIDESKALKPADKQHLNEICGGETGVAISSMAFFSAARSYFTGLLNNPEKFVAYAEKETGAKAQEENGAKVIRNIAVIGNQFWICTTGTPDVEQLSYYQKLNDKQSYVSNDAAALLLDTEKVANYVADVNRSLSLVPQAGYLKLATSLIFNDMAYVAGSADIKDKSLVANASVLNSDMKPAELLLPVEKIDGKVVKAFGGNASLFMAAGIPKKLTKKISDLAGSMMGNNSKAISDVLESIDGTIAARVDSNGDNAEFFIQTSGKNFNELSSMLQSLFGLTVTRNGDVLTAIHGNPSFTGNISPDQAAEKLKGAWIGIVSDGFIARDVTTVTKLSVDKKSLRLDFEAEGGVDALINGITR